MRPLLDANQAADGLRRMAEQIRERHGTSSELVLIGVRRGGIPVMQVLRTELERLEGHPIPAGSVDITLYRDDAATALPNPRIGASDIPTSIEGRHVLLIDDVAYTRRTTRAALDAVLDYGRPRLVELAVLIDRSGRELPIQPDYSVLRVDLAPNERIDVFSDATGLRAVVQPANAPSLPPSPE